MELETKDLMVLKMVRSGASVREIAEAIGAKSSNTAHERLKKLIENGFIVAPPKKKMARCWKLTDLGLKALAPYDKSIII